MDPDSTERSTGERAFAGRAILAAFTLTAAMVALVTCTRQDPIAPDGSVITVTANPQTVVSQGGLAGTTRIIATLRSKNGTRLPDQEVTFSTSAGTLRPPAQTVIVSNSQGQSSCFLDTTSSATVTAFSGSISGTTTVNIVSGNLSSINLDANGTDILNSCTAQSTLVATATDPNVNGVAGVTIVFSTTAIPSDNLLKGTFNPSQPRTDISGTATTIFTPDASFCSANCILSSDPNAPNGARCGIRVVAQDVSGNFRSPSIDIITSIQ